MNWYESLGIIGGLIGNIGLLPQIWKLFRYKSAFEISLPFLCLWLISTACWLTYGVLLGAFSIILWNSITFLLASLMLAAKLKWGMRPKQVKAA